MTNFNYAKNDLNSTKTIEDFEFLYLKLTRRIINDDVKTFEKNCKMKWFEWIPVIGAYIYILRMTYYINGINRGALRKNIFLCQIVYVLATLVYPGIYILLLFPVVYFYILKFAIKRTKQQLVSDKFH